MRLIDASASDPWSVVRMIGGVIVTAANIHVLVHINSWWNQPANAAEFLFLATLSQLDYSGVGKDRTGHLSTSDSRPHT